MRRRQPKDDDQKNTEKAYKILCKTVEEHPEIETSLWAGALMSAFVDMHQNTKFTYKNFCEVLDDIKEVYKNWFED